MSHLYYKTEYQEEEGYSGGCSIVKKTLYVHHNLSCDIVVVKDQNGETILSFNDTVKDNILDAINSLMYPLDGPQDHQDLMPRIERMTIDEINKIF